jgi:hypothetical protein
MAASLSLHPDAAAVRSVDVAAQGVPGVGRQSALQLRHAPAYRIGAARFQLLEDGRQGMLLVPRPSVDVGDLFLINGSQFAPNGVRNRFHLLVIGFFHTEYQGRFAAEIGGFGKGFPRCPGGQPFTE